MSAHPQAIYNRLPVGAFSRGVVEAKPTRAQSVLEYILFGVFATMMLLAAVAFVALQSSTHKQVPNLVAAGVAEDRVNVLVIVATSRKNYEDTHALKLVSIKPSTRDVAMVSIPNDLWVEVGRYGTRRLGSAVSVGRSSGYPGGGPGLLTDTVHEVLGQRVHAFIKVSPRELTRQIDSIGGIDVDVPRGIYNAKTGERFYRGQHHFDGPRAVRYAISRRMTGQANDRFAREARQRAVLAALLAHSDQLDFNSSAGMNPNMTNLTSGQVQWLRGMVSGRAARTVTFAPYVDVFAVSTFVDQGEALKPRSGDFDQIRRIAANVFGPSLRG